MGIFCFNGCFNIHIKGGIQSGLNLFHAGLRNVAAFFLFSFGGMPLRLVIRATR